VSAGNNLRGRWTGRPHAGNRTVGVRAAVPDFNRTANYFRDVLGFRILWEEATDWRLAERDGVRVMLGHCPNATLASETGPHNLFGYLGVNDVDALRAELTERGAQCSAPTNTAYGMREVMVTTIDGHRIVFGQDSPVPNS
jgi:catechol 2,3-dioxygenase-like lactoylglutathione lyase family enzyme